MYMLLYPIQFININYQNSLTFNPLDANVSKLYAQNACLCVGSFTFVLSIIITLRSAKPSCSSPKKMRIQVLASHMPDPLPIFPKRTLMVVKPLPKSCYSTTNINLKTPSTLK